MKQTGSLFPDTGDARDIRETLLFFYFDNKQSRYGKTLYDICASMNLRKMAKIKFDDAANHQITRPTRTEKKDAGGAR